MRLQTKILAGYLVLVAVICSMAAILVHERGRMREIEANTTTASIINGMARMHLLDKIILCTIPVIAGNGCRLVLGDLPESEWMRDETKTYKDGSLKAVYRKNEGATVQKVNTSRLKNKPQKIPSVGLPFAR